LVPDTGEVGLGVGVVQAAEASIMIKVNSRLSFLVIDLYQALQAGHDKTGPAKGMAGPTDQKI
jgi:hypothetical protein